MSKLKEIIEGHINEFRSIVGTENEVKQKIFDSRAAICLKCPLKLGNTCNKSKYINPKTLEVSDTKSINNIQGCGCRLSAKQRSESSECPAKFWGGEFNK